VQISSIGDSDECDTTVVLTHHVNEIVELFRFCAIQTSNEFDTTVTLAASKIGNVTDSFTKSESLNSNHFAISHHFGVTVKLVDSSGTF
jgi:hypothetical protein